MNAPVATRPQNRTAQHQDLAVRPPLVRVRNLHVAFDAATGPVQAVNGVDFDVNEGETLCLLGESGCGKSVTLRALMGLNPPRRTRTSGTVQVAGHDMVRASEGEINQVRGTVVSMIFQEPMTALDPVFTIGQQIAETVRTHEKIDRAAARRRALELLELVQVPSAARRLDAYPHELSGGLRQRAMIAMALSCKPRLLLADEPTTALDATVQIQVLLLLRQLQQELGMALVFVTHDLGVACEVADRIAVMYAGRFVEEAPAAAFVQQPLHPYAQGLLGSRVHGAARGRTLPTIPGAPPRLDRLPPGCSFAERCHLVTQDCRAAQPALREVGMRRFARCVLVPSQA